MAENGGKIRPVIIARFGPPCLACIRSWGALGLQTGLVQIKAPGEGYAKSRFLSESITLPGRMVDTEEGMAHIINFLKRFGASGVTCIDEKIGIWLRVHSWEINKLAPVWLPDEWSIRATLSKKRQVAIAEQAELELLPTFLIKKSAMDNLDIDAAHFPVCVRPGVPGGIVPQTKVKLLFSQIELMKWVAGLKKVDCDIIAQPFVDGPNVVIHGARSQHGEIIGWQGFIVERKFEGVTLAIRPFGLPDGLKSRCKKFLSALDIRGNFHFEFVMDKNSRKLYFLEINPRFGGTTAKVYALGYDEPALFLGSYGANIRNVSHNPRNMGCTNKMAVLKYLNMALKNQLSPLDYPSERLSKKISASMKMLLFCKDDVISRRDMTGTLAHYSAMLKDAVKKAQ